MPIIDKPAKDWVFEQLNKDNPSDQPDFTPSNLLLGTPTAITVTNRPDLNTQVSAAAIGGDYVGNRPFQYRRIDLFTLFRGVPIILQKYTPIVADGRVRVVYTLYQLLDLLNEKYGVKLTQDDVSDVYFSTWAGRPKIDGYYSHTLTMKAKPNSYGYIGQVSVTWQDGAQELPDMIVNRELDGRMFPGGNDFSGDHPIILNSAAYSQDYSLLAKNNQWNGYPNSVIKSTQDTRLVFMTFIYAVADELNERLGMSIPKPAVGTGSIADTYTAEVVTLPSTKYPEANSEQYNRCMVVVPPDTWGVGSLFIHYNV